MNYFYCLIMILLLGCDAKVSQDQVEERFNGLIDKFFAANDSNSAKDCLLEMTSLLDKNGVPCKQNFFQASHLFVVYLRLFVLAEKQGHPQEAKIYFEKARYWSMIRKECLNEPPDKVLKMDTLTPERARKFVEGLDKKRLEDLDDNKNAPIK